MQPLHSGIISLPGSPKTWTWKQSPILAPTITEKSQKGAPNGSQEAPKVTLKSIVLHSVSRQKLDIQNPKIWTLLCPKIFRKKNLLTEKATIINSLQIASKIDHFPCCSLPKLDHLWILSDKFSKFRSFTIFIKFWAKYVKNLYKSPVGLGFGGGDVG